MNAVLADGVWKSFGGLDAVADLSLAIPRGSVFGLIGPNGSGKSTTLRMIMNILLPDRGSIEVLGARDTRTARDRISYLPEERGLYRKMKIRRLLRYYGRLKGLGRADADRAIDRWLGRLGLAVWADERVEALSKGMSQKVQFVAALLAEPELMILDEPFSGLDPVNADELKQVVLELRQRGCTVIFSTHDMRTAESLCDRIAMIFRGRKVLDGTLDEIQARYGEDTLRIRTADGRAALDGMAGIQSIVDRGNVQEVRIEGDAQVFLKALAARTAVLQFEITPPSLHDIFVRIARVDHGEPGEHGAGASDG